jgi:hypothetical protein
MGVMAGIPTGDVRLVGLSGFGPDPAPPQDHLSVVGRHERACDQAVPMMYEVANGCLDPGVSVARAEAGCLKRHGIVGSVQLPQGSGSAAVGGKVHEVF